MIPDYYKILGISTSATKEEIKKAYRQLALKFHPDKNHSPDAHEKFISINQAYLILNDDEGRRKYDLEYQRFFSRREKEDSFDTSAKQRNYQRPKTEEPEPKFDDEDLNKWARNAKEQAEGFAAMTFKEFTNLVIGMVKETGFQLGNAIILMLGGFLFMGGCGSAVYGITSGESMSIVIPGILFMVVGFFIYKYSAKNYDNH